MDTPQYTIRRFGHGADVAYKAIRLEALREEPGMFGNSYAKEAAYDAGIWTGRLANPDVACFGLYADDALIGLTSILRDAEKPDEAYMTQSYIRRAHRGKGLSRLLYDARIAWARAHGLRRLTIGHRESNAASGAAVRHYGFQFTHRAPRTWPDGGEEDMIYYALEL